MSFPDQTCRRFLDECAVARTKVNDKERNFMIRHAETVEFSEGQQRWVARMISKYGAQFGFELES